jgi:osmotically-inducible protein OsmY
VITHLFAKYQLASAISFLQLTARHILGGANLLKEIFSMKSDSQIKTDVMEELAWDPEIDANGIGVMVTSGVVTLTGHLNTYAEKYAVEKAVRRVAGVRGIAIELDVKLSIEHKRSDSEIALAAIAALRWNTLVPDERVKVEVSNGWVTLTGELDWSYQSNSAAQSIRSLMGVRGLTNKITLKPMASSSDIVGQISAALKRQAEREAKHIGIEVDGSAVTLRGKVHSLAEHDAAVGAAYTARGVARVIDKLEIA